MTEREKVDGTASETQARVIGPLDGLAIVVGSMLGIGIFLTPPQVATHLPTLTGYLLAWLAGGIIAFCGAVAYAELGTRFPRAGGDYVFLDEAFGSSVSFAAGWLLFVGVFVGSLATMAVPLAAYQLPVLLGPVVELEPGRVLLVAGPVELTVARALAIGIIVVLTLLNVLGTKLSSLAQVLLTGTPVVVFALGALFIFVTTPAASLALPAGTEADWNVVGFGRAVLAVYFAYAGWNAIAYVGGEIREPDTTMPRALLGGTVLTTLLYLLLAGCFVWVLGIVGLQGAGEAGTAAARDLGGPGMTWFVTALIATGLVGSLNATVLSGGRVGWSMARQGAFVEALGTLDDRFGTPARILWLQGGLAIAFVVTGTFEILLELTSLAMFLMSALTIVALLRIRRRDGEEAPYQATLYPWAPLLFLVVSLVVIGASIYRAVAGADKLTVASLYPLLGLVLFAVIWAGHRVWRRTAR